MKAAFLRITLALGLTASVLGCSSSTQQETDLDGGLADSPAADDSPSAPDTGGTGDAADAGRVGEDSGLPDTGNQDGGVATDADAGSNVDGAPATDAADATSGEDAGGDSSLQGDDASGHGDDASSSDAGPADATLGGGDASSDDAGTPSPDAADDTGVSSDDAGDGGVVGLPDAADGSAPIDAGPPPDAGTIDFVTGVTVSTLAGSDVAGSLDGTGGAAQFDDPTGIAIDALGNLLVTDYTGSLVRRVTPQGEVMTLAKASGFVGPFAAVVATDGAYYVETDFNSAGVKNATSGTIWRVVPLGDGGVTTPSVVAQGFARPRGLTAIAGGDLFLADRSLDIVQTLSVADGGASFVAGSANVAGFQDGTGAGAEFNMPIGVATLADGSVLVADTNNNRIRRVDTSGVVTTFAGDGAPGVNDGPRLSAEFNAPRDVAVDGFGNVYVSDAGNHRIRRILTNGNVDTLAGDGSAGFNNGAGAGAEFYGQEGIDVTTDGKIVYVADGNSGDGSGYNRIRAIAIP